MYLEMPVRSDLPSYNFQTDLEGTTYDLEFNWNSRGGYWMMDIKDQDKNPILLGIRLVSGFGLLYGYKVAGLPPGQFVAFDTANEDKDAGIDDLGTRVLLIYRESTTVDEAV